MRRVAAIFTPVLLACSTAGSAWMAEPLGNDYEPVLEESDRRPPGAGGARQQRPVRRSVSLGQRAATPGALPAVADTTLAAGGRSLGTFRNTYYDFPSESDFQGDQVALKSAGCDTIALVPRGFYESVCVQGSGTLMKGSTVSFAKRDCGCAEVCPRTEQRICFDELDSREFPWGRGATGKGITPLITVAVDSELIPLGTPIFVPEFAGLPRDPAEKSLHDGCFVAQDRGLRVKGKHVDVFTGHQSMTTLWNRRVPSNMGVTVVVESPRCARVTR